MATNEILRFAETDTGTNLLTQAEYLADSQRPIGNQPGVARSKLVNKALRQASLIAAGLAEYIADNQANNITDALTPQNIADYLQAAITGALGVTPPQFDNDTSLATTAFVQRALGNFQVGLAFASATTLTAADVGKSIVLGGASSYAVNLPLLSSVPDGAAIVLVSNTQLASVTVQRQGADVINMSSQTATSFVLNNGDSAVLVKASGTWRLISGSAQLPYSTLFGSSLAASGYQKLPSGLIIQWGPTIAVNLATGAATTQSLTFPIAFPNAVLSWSVQLTSQKIAAGFAVTSNTGTTIGFENVANAGNDGSVSGKWIAIGY